MMSLLLLSLGRAKTANYTPPPGSVLHHNTGAEFHSVCLSVQDTKQVLQGGRERSMEPIEPPPLHDTLQNYTRSPIV